MSEDSLRINCCNIEQDVKVNIREDNMWEAIATKCGCKREVGKMEMNEMNETSSDGKLNMELKFVPVKLNS